jgi:dihydropteroate synthase
MAIVNRTPDSFYDNGATFGSNGRSIDSLRLSTTVPKSSIGAVKAAPDVSVSMTEERDRTVEFVDAVRAMFPGLVFSVDTWRHEVGEAV